MPKRLCLPSCEKHLELGGHSQKLEGGGFGLSELQNT